MASSSAPSSLRPAGSRLRRLLRALRPALALGVPILAAHCGFGGFDAPPLPDPFLTSFTADKVLLTAGDSTSLTAVFGYGLGTVDQGVGAVASGVPKAVTPQDNPTTYTLTVTAPGGTVLTRALTIQLVDPPQPPVISGVPDVVAPGATGLTATVPDQPGCTFTWTLDKGTIAAGGKSRTVTFSAAPFGQLVLTCTATNAAGSAATSAPLIRQLGGPTIKAFSVSPTGIAAGQSATLSYDFTGGTGVITPGDTSVEPDRPGTLQVDPDTTTTYKLTVTDRLDRFDQKSVTLAVGPAPEIARFTASPRMLGPGASTSLTADFTAGPGVSASVDQGVGPVLPGQARPVGPLQHSTTFTLTVAAGGAPSVATARVLVGSLASLAGTASGEGSLDGALGAARYRDPAGLVRDRDGNLVVADTGNHTLRRVLRTGVVETLAGAEGVPGSADGLRGQARFNHPAGLALDPRTGNVFVADTDNDVIRVVTPEGLVTTLAGRAGEAGAVDDVGTAARFNLPTGLAVTADGAILFVADTGSHTIRRIFTDTTSVATLAGDAAAAPGCVDAQGAEARFHGPTGLAWNGAGQALYVADTGNNNLRMVNLVGGVQTLAGDVDGQPGAGDGTGTAARLRAPRALALDAAGDLFVADAGNHTLREILPGWVVTTVSGLAGQPGSANGAGSAARWWGPAALAFTAGGSLAAADTGNDTLRELDVGTFEVITFSGLAPAPGAADGTGAAAGLRRPKAAALGSDGNLYVADAGNHTIRRITPAGAATRFAGTSQLAGRADGPALQASFDAPEGVAVATDASGAVIVYVADTGNHTVRMIRNGQVSTLAGTPGAAGDADGPALDGASFRAPAGVAVAGNGDVLVADTGNHLVRKIRDGLVSTLAGIAGRAGAADGYADEATFSAPRGLAAAGDGAVIYVADTGNHTVRVIEDGKVRTLAGSPGQAGAVDGAGAAARLNGPAAIALDRLGNLLVAETGGSTIRQVTPDGAATLVIGDPVRSGFAATALPGQLPPPRGLAVDPDNDNLYITVHDAVLKVDFTQ